MLAGAPAAFDAFVNYFRSKIFNYSWLMCGHREDAEEVAQETLLKVFENMAQLRDPENVKPWIFRIARNMCLTKRRRSRFAPDVELSLDHLMPGKNGGPAEMMLEIADWSALPDAQALRGELAHFLDMAIQELPEHYRSVLLLRDMEEISTSETARILDLTEDVVRTRLHRARLSVRRTLDEYLRVKQHGGESLVATTA